MAVLSYIRGHEIYFNEQMNEWLYSDSYGTIRKDRYCKRCGKPPTKEGYDACIGYVANKKSVCCGHGVSESISIE